MSSVDKRNEMPVGLLSTVDRGNEAGACRGREDRGSCSTPRANRAAGSGGLITLRCHWAGYGHRGNACMCVGELRVCALGCAGGVVCALCGAFVHVVLYVCVIDLNLSEMFPSSPTFYTQQTCKHDTRHMHKRRLTRTCLSGPPDQWRPVGSLLFSGSRVGER